jgi:4-hydroxy 2-oxovalerate aldolase
MKILDCTLRDGGYYNNWDFSHDLIQEYLYVMADLPINYVEIGFRRYKNEGFLGPCAFSKLSFLNTLDIPVNLKLAVMINATEIMEDGGSVSSSRLSDLFPSSPEVEKIKLVRIACSYLELFTIKPALEWLRSEGFLVGLNLIQISELTDDEIINSGAFVNAAQPDVFYFADSLGSMTDLDIKNVINLLRVNWDGDIGIHTHDNMGLALKNSLYANNLGVEWVDSTVLGMGRGPGNAKTEELLIEFSEKNNIHLNLVPLINLIDVFFSALKKQYNWGTNAFYYLAAKNSIHPSYIQEMLGAAKYRNDDIYRVIDFLKNTTANRFNRSNIDVALALDFKDSKGSWIPSSVIKGKTVLILGNGPSVMKYKFAIESFVKNNSPVVIGLNSGELIDESLINFRVCSHPLRFLAEADKLAQIETPLVMPWNSISKSVQEKLNFKKVFNFGLMIKEGTFSFFDKECIAPNYLAFSYAIALSRSGQASQILLAGFDGYQDDERRQREMVSVIESYQRLLDGVLLNSITPTNYRIPILSVYGL